MHSVDELLPPFEHHACTVGCGGSACVEVLHWPTLTIENGLLAPSALTYLNATVCVNRQIFQISGIEALLSAKVVEAIWRTSSARFVPPAGS